MTAIVEHLKSSCEHHYDVFLFCFSFVFVLQRHLCGGRCICLHVLGSVMECKDMQWCNQWKPFTGAGQVLPHQLSLASPTAESGSFCATETGCSHANCRGSVPQPRHVCVCINNTHTYIIICLNRAVGLCEIAASRQADFSDKQIVLQSESVSRTKQKNSPRKDKLHWWTKAMIILHQMLFQAFLPSILAFVILS